MGNASSGLMRLRPVTFRYKPEHADGQCRLQYGLIAEEVAQIYPDLVQYDPNTGQPHTISYHLINAMLLNEVQKQHRQVLDQRQEISALKEQNKELMALKEQMKELTGLKEQNEQLSARVSRMEPQLSRLATGIGSQTLDYGRLSRLQARTDQLTRPHNVVELRK
jgi:hypothetical protein